MTQRWMTRRLMIRCSIVRWLPLCATATALLAWSTVVVPALPPDPWVRTGANVAGALVLLLTGRRHGLSWQQLGLARSSWRPGARWGAIALGAVAAGYAVVLAVPALRSVLQDLALQAPSTGQLAARVLLLIPVGTVLCEEVAFRGVLLATALRVLPTQPALGVTAAVFGLWHIGPAMTNDQNASVIVLVTGAGGLLLGWLRQRTGSLLAPIGLHLGTNSVGLVAVALAAQ